MHCKARIGHGPKIKAISRAIAHHLACPISHVGYIPALTGAYTEKVLSDVL